MSITDEIAAKHLGKRSEGSEFYDKSLLVAVPRQDNRDKYMIDSSDLPFIGYDIWNCYEVSFFTESGVPCNYVMKIKYPANSPFIVESKSLKLYLNSFNMTPLKSSVAESEKYFKDTVEKDLSEILHTCVKVYLHKDFTSDKSETFSNYEKLSDKIDLESLSCSAFKECPEILSYDPKNSDIDIKICFDALRSNCRITHQPDFGDLFIHIKTSYGINLSNLFKYLVSFRKEYHFHEECVEMIYKRLLDKYSPETLMVGALYTRRGGIDICPIRANKEELLDKELLDISKYTKRTIKQ